MTRRVTLLVLTMAAALGLASGVAWAITDGEPDKESHPYVGLVVFYDQAGEPIQRCSGTLLSPTVFLTAGHCTDGTVSAQVWFDPKITPEPGGYPYSGDVKGTPHTHPDFKRGRFSNNDRSDLGVVVLDQKVEKEQYGELPELGVLDALATRRGQQEQTFTVVGYGLQAGEPKVQADRERYRGSVALIDLRSALNNGYDIQYTTNPGERASGGICNGDSGGPLLLNDTNTVVGVHSWGFNDNCVGTSFDYRTDIKNAQDFIKPYLSTGN